MRNASLCRCVLIVVGLFVAQASADLPRIKVAGARFVTELGKPFVPFGVNYYRPGTGWAPQVWTQWDPQAIRRDLIKLKSMGGNCARVFISFGSFYDKPGSLKEEGLRKFDEFLKIAEDVGIYVHPTGPDHWEGSPSWVGDRFAEESTLAAQETFWKLFAARYKGRKVIFAYDLLNEPMIAWKGAPMKARWNQWLLAKYGSVQKAAEAWGILIEPGNGEAAIPEVGKASEKMLLDYQLCREEIADEWTRRQAAAIKAADPDALVTVGLIQWAVPVVLPRLEHYAGFRPQRQAQWLDFMEVHFYPLESGVYDYADVEQGQRNLAYAEAVVREVAKTGKPVVLAEYGWHGGGTFPMGDRQSKFGSEQDQATWCSTLIATTEGLACGWLNWGFHDHPQAGDVSRHTGLLTVEGKEKAWGRKFKELAAKYQGKSIAEKKVVAQPVLPWDQCITSIRAGEQFRQEYYKAFAAERSGQ